MTNIMVVEDGYCLRKRLETIFQRDRSTHLLVQEQTVAKALYRCFTHQPDIVVIDLTLFDGRGMTIVRSIARACPEIAIVAAVKDHSYRVEYDVKRAGANTCIAPHMTDTQIAEAIQLAYTQKYRGIALSPEHTLPDMIPSYLR